MYCYLPAFQGLFEPFRRDLTRSKGTLHFKNHLVYATTVNLRISARALISNLEEDGGRLFEKGVFSRGWELI